MHKLLGDKKSSNEEKPAAKSGGGAGWGFLGWIMPKQKNQVHLPDDKKRSVNMIVTVCKPSVSKLVKLCKSSVSKLVTVCKPSSKQASYGV